MLWAWRHQLRRFAFAAAATSGLVLVIGYLPVLAGASHVLGDADKTVTNGSPWNWLVDRLLRHDAWRNVPNPLAPNATLSAFFYLGAATVLLLGVILGWLAARDPRPEPAVGVALAAYPVAAEYAYPWYSAWALPVFAANGLSAAQRSGVGAIGRSARGPEASHRGAGIADARRAPGPAHRRGTAVAARRVRGRRAPAIPAVRMGTGRAATTGGEGRGSGRGPTRSAPGVR